MGLGEIAIFLGFLALLVTVENNDSVCVYEIAMSVGHLIPLAAIESPLQCLD